MAAPPPSYNEVTGQGGAQAGGYPTNQQPGGGYSNPMASTGYDGSQYPPPQPVYSTPGSGAPPQGYPPPQGYAPPPHGGYAQTQQPQGGYSQPGGYAMTQQAPPPYPPPAGHDGGQDTSVVENDPAYPPGSNPDPYFTQQFQMQPSVFSPEFNAQYMADYSKPEAGPLGAGFVPPNAVPPNEVSEVDSCVCMPDKSDFGCCYMVRISVSTMAHLGFIGSLVAIIFFAVTGIAIPLGLFGALGGCYFIIFLETFCAYDFRYLKDIKDGANFAEFMQNLHTALPALTLHVECYHYETRYYTEHYTDSKGRSHTRRKSKRVKVVTHREQEIFQYSRCQDMAPPNINVEGKKATRIVFYRTYTFADDRTRSTFETQSLNIRARNRNRDRHMSYYENFTVPGFTERMLAFVDPDAKHPCFNPILFVLASLVLCTWPFRWWFRRVTAKTSYTFIKQLGV